MTLIPCVLHFLFLNTVQTYFSEYLVLEPSIYDEISSTRYLTRKYRSRQEGKGLERNISSESLCDLRGYFALGDSVVHFSPIYEDSAYHWSKPLVRGASPEWWPAILASGPLG